MKRLVKIPFERLLLIVVLLIYISISHFFLPVFKKDDFLFFFQWNMFSFMPMTKVRDITWDEGKTFFFRDYRWEAMSAGINIHTLFYLLNSSHGINTIQKYFYPELMKFCKCQNLKLVELEGSLSEHIIYTKPLKIKRQDNL